MLELTTRADESPGYVRIDERTYEMANPSHFGLRAGGEIWRSVERIAALEQLAEPSEADEREYRERLERIARVAVPELEAEVIAKLATGQLADLVVSFFALVAATSPRLGTLMRTTAASSPAGTTSSPSSSASTAASR
ncbi:MAG: hypothetical protein KGK07_06335 [Chloroflexota bacterium]|nr:hypothetical protein [Chloroflexota bacterium]